jgi:hypothetical protein
VSGAPMTATLRVFGQTGPTCTGAPSNRNGESSCTLNSGYNGGLHTILEVKFVHQGQTWETTISVFPR